MTRLTHDMRTAMQIMTRELRRANYHPGWIACYGNTGCRTTLGIESQVNAIQIGTSVDAGDCVWFWYDRPQICPTTTCTVAELAAVQTAITAESVAAFRRTVTDDVGRLQMTTTRTTAAACDSSADWVDITDPNVIDVLSFTVSNAESILETINTAGATLLTEKIGLTMTAKLTADASVPAWIKNNANASRELTEFVKVRNNFTTAP
jgi:hypothetical protein